MENKKIFHFWVKISSEIILMLISALQLNYYYREKLKFKIWKEVYLSIFLEKQLNLKDDMKKAFVLWFNLFEILKYE